MRANETECITHLQGEVSDCREAYNRVSYILARLLEKMGYKELTNYYYFIGNPYGEPIMQQYKNGDSNIRVAAPLLYDICGFIYKKTGLVFSVDKSRFQYAIGTLHKELVAIPGKSLKNIFYLSAITIDKYPARDYKSEVEKAIIKICNIYLKCKKIKLE